MILRILFIGEGPSDSGITTHIGRITAEHGHTAVITDPLSDRLPPPPRRTVAAKLQAVKDLGGAYDLVAVHRDADAAGRSPRLEEIHSAVQLVMPDTAHVPVIPIRMTEAWLLLDEAEIRRVAGSPNGRVPLGLPNARRVESIPDPKALLAHTLAIASELRGRRLDMFKKRLSEHRRQLLDGINPDGPIRDVQSWRDFNADLSSGLEQQSGKHIPASDSLSEGAGTAGLAGPSPGTPSSGRGGVV